jgi:hypothetical protein
MANWKSITKKIKSAPVAKKAMKSKIKKVFDREKELLIQNFLKHPVTKEIKAGPIAPNESGTLGGYGNLFTFIGFPESADPIRDVLHLLTFITKIKKVSSSTKPKDIKFNISISVPSNSDFTLSAPLPWEGGKSWVLGIERGISGFGAYMYDKMYASGSRSGRGFQAKKPGVGTKSYNKTQKIRAGGFRNVKYMSEMINRFYARLKREE